MTLGFSNLRECCAPSQLYRVIITSFLNEYNSTSAINMQDIVFLLVRILPRLKSFLLIKRFNKLD
jgi:hypothetical protein